MSSREDVGHDSLVGRRDILGAAVSGLREGSRAMVLCGIAGSGKTAVCEAVSNRLAAAGWQVSSVTCHPSERDLAFGVLTSVLHTIAPGLSEIDHHDPLRLRLRVLSALTRDTHADRLIVIDDVHWSDDTSLSVLGFVARRLQGTRTSIFLAARGEAPPVCLAGSPRLDLEPLSDPDAGLLLQQADIDLKGVALSTVLNRAAGNPLALLELGRAALHLTPGALLPSTVEVSFEEQVQRLPELSRSVLLLAAACDGDLAALGTILPASLLDDLAPAERAGLVRVVRGRVEFRHPLARSATYGSATTVERLQAHRSLAEAYTQDPERRIWHLAEATAVPDEHLAGQLESVAEGLRIRGAAHEGARLLHRAAALTPSRSERERRLLQSVFLFSVAGRFDWVVEIASKLRDESDDPAIRIGAAHNLAYALSQTERGAVARVVVVELLDQLLAVDPFWGWSTLTTFAVLVYRSGEDLGDLRAWLHRYETSANESTSPLASMIPACRTYVRIQANGLVRDPADVQTVYEATPPEELPLDVAGTHEMMLGAAAFSLDEPQVAIDRLVRAINYMRRAEAPGEMPQTLHCLALVYFEIANIDSAEETAREALDMVESRNLAYPMVDAIELLLRGAALRGDTERGRVEAHRLRELLTVGESLAHEAHLRVSMSWIRWAEDDVAGAWEEMRWLFHEDGSPLHLRLSHRELGHYAAAAVRAGAADAVRPVVDLAAQRVEGSSMLIQFQVSRARALLAGEDAEPWFVQAVSDPAMRQWPFDLANARLEYGAWLRRRHRQGEARAQLHEALSVFERIGTRPWVRLATAELRAAGVTVATSSSPASVAAAGLTAQEQLVVEMAASGLTNQEIATALHLSKRTVSTHLYNAFPKLGVSSRGQLRDLLSPAATNTAG